MLIARVVRNRNGSLTDFEMLDDLFEPGVHEPCANNSRHQRADPSSHDAAQQDANAGWHFENVEERVAERRAEHRSNTDANGEAAPHVGLGPGTVVHQACDVAVGTAITRACEQLGLRPGFPRCAERV